MPLRKFAVNCAFMSGAFMSGFFAHTIQVHHFRRLT